MTSSREVLAGKAVVVGFDASDESTAATTWAAREAEARGRPLVVVRAFEWQWPPMPVPTPAAVSVLPDDGGQVRSAVQAQLDRGVAEIRRANPGVDVGAVVTDGHPALALATVADEIDAELVVIGASGAGAVERALLGSTASELVRTTHRPAVVVRGTARRSAAERVVVGIDGTPTSRRAMGFALDFAARHGYRVGVVHAWTDSLLDPVLEPVLSGPGGEGGLRATADALVSSQLADWRDRYPEVPVDRLEPEGRPADVLLAQAEDAALLVVGSHGRGPVRRAVLGSVSHQVLQRAGCPVAVLRELDNSGRP
ncbi:universal stress protein [Amycolatopsis sp. NBRC 101858]|uniref:universal stress protein n=1 Tax=Amycolatopsis sp. NBRC 101858 TaxID=3032200 RepID=UPI0024A0917B|nr:universal stress protein [Amycolatopsis sp. NBRC 101858]GLY42725.1 universal stress protein [Amycolatopsis sp. NBRC 101858]